MLSLPFLLLSIIILFIIIFNIFIIIIISIMCYFFQALLFVSKLNAVKILQGPRYYFSGVWRRGWWWTLCPPWPRGWSWGPAQSAESYGRATERKKYYTSLFLIICKKGDEKKGKWWTNRQYQREINCMDVIIITALNNQIYRKRC